MPTSAKLLAEMKLLHPQLIDLSLGRVERLLGKLGDPHNRLPPVVHIAGTNGKGSVTAYLKAILEAAGARVHVYTSPHLVRFHERIELAGASGKAHANRRGHAGRRADAHAGDQRQRRRHPVRDHHRRGLPRLRRAPRRRAAARGRPRRPARRDERRRAAGARRSSRRSRSTTRRSSARRSPKIASEKAGILRPGVPAVVSQQEPEAEDVIRAEALRVGAPLIVWGEQFDAYEQRGRLVVQLEELLLDLPLPALIGRHQIVNAGTAVAAALQLAAGLPHLAWANAPSSRD